MRTDILSVDILRAGEKLQKQAECDHIYENTNSENTLTNVNLYKV